MITLYSPSETNPQEMDGQWSAWINDGTCSKTCGGGKQKQERSCTHPSPQNGGRGCSGDSTRSIDCNPQPCKVDGQWSAWINVGSCSKTCGGGTQKQERSCTNPSPQNGGRGCSGDSTRSIDCYSQPCKVDGQWSSWINVGSCSKTCGGGTQKQERSCTNPTPRNGGRGCSGDSTRSIDCNSQPCKVDGQWSDWVNDGSCSKTCGGGKQKQERSCTNPAPRNAGRSCRGDSTRSIDCNSQPCPGACQKRTENAGCVVTIFYSGICKQTAPKFAPCPYEAYIYEDEGNSSQATIRINGTSTVLKEGQSYEKCATFSLTNFTLIVKESFCNLFELENLIG
ncbi:hypothetical protein FSP39_016236 [Pinctada imbricata]|uniref:Hemicentin-1 n=1 Tax=Pinctada imbricata TaxID=66713 RepID=A0AA89BZI2_PINIB|nr:hypothetical protein FSP39_016236 [Pinctada imbricata]